ncbi:CHASE2 domain-containing protein [Pseudomonas sp. Irchel s3b6]|uniref:CHASE2 domain-containing protein n=1 Tax=Pseudomonas sp. Irchel s3b6 TaxID=2009078 RepID=UPI000BA3D8FB|nr:CHASE2 domain-containing protein [Pseudomonas sp. Irchel s3b6]
MSAKFPLFSLKQYALGLVVLLIALLDPFGLSSSSDNASAQWLNRMFASLYDSKGQQQIAVVVIDDAYLLRNNTFWPMPYGEQSKLFKRLLAYKPKAVFVDLLYSHDHSPGDPAQGSQLLANVFDRYRHQGIPLLLANTGRPRGEEGQANTLEHLAQVTTPVLVVWSGVGDKYPLAFDAPQGLMETPALALYRQYCQAHQCPDLPGDAQAAAQAPPIAIQWGLELAPEQARIANTADCSTVDGFFSQTLKQLAEAIFWKLGKSAQASCPYSLTLTASDLEVSEPQDRALIAALLRDRLVLVGAHITSTGDLVQSPVHGKLPGIYLHAMALDNLLSEGMSYKHEPDSLPRMDINWLDLVEIALLVLIVVLKALHEHRAAKHRTLTPWRRWEIRFFHSPCPSWLLVMTVLTVASIALYFANITPVNVLGIAVLSLVLFSEKIEALLGSKS